MYLYLRFTSLRAIISPSPSFWLQSWCLEPPPLPKFHPSYLPWYLLPSTPSFATRAPVLLLLFLTEYGGTCSYVALAQCTYDVYIASIPACVALTV